MTRDLAELQLRRRFRVARPGGVDIRANSYEARAARALVAAAGLAQGSRGGSGAAAAAIYSGSLEQRRRAGYRCEHLLKKTRFNFIKAVDAKAFFYMHADPSAPASNVSNSGGLLDTVTHELNVSKSGGFQTQTS